MRALTSFVLAILLTFPTLNAYAEFKVEMIKKAVPDSVSQEIAGFVTDSAFQIQGDDGKPMINLWLGNLLNVQSKPAGAKGTILYPFLSEGQLLGVVEVFSEIGDYRDQPIVAGVYTLRYGIQPVNGDHLGASPYRDFGCLIPTAIDQSVATLKRDKLEENSAEAAGTSHPAIMMFLAPESGAKSGSLVRDDENDRTSIVVPLKVKAGSDSAEVMIQWIFQGRAPV